MASQVGGKADSSTVFYDEAYSVLLILCFQVLSNTPCCVGPGMRTILIAGAASTQGHLSP